jgi:hypothetical protein
MIPLPYVALAGLLMAVGSFFYGISVGKDSEKANRAEAIELARETRKLALDGALEAIGKQRPIHKTIQTETKEVIREVPVYRDCKHDPAVERLLDSARANGAGFKPEAGVPSGSGQGESP